MKNSAESQNGFYSALKHIFLSTCELAKTRFSLFLIELEEEKERFITMIFIGAIGLLFAGLSLITLTILILASFWDTWRWQSIVILTVLYALVALFCALRCRAIAQRIPKPFENTVNEFKKDSDIFENKY